MFVTSRLWRQCYVSVLLIFGTHIVARVGYYDVIRYSIWWKIIVGVLYIYTGPINSWWIMGFLLLDGCFVGAAFGLIHLPLSDISDDDTVRYQRRHRATSMVYGTNALIVKPAQSLSPILTVAILNKYGYDKLGQATFSPSERDLLHKAMFQYLCLLPACVGLIQLIAWSFFSIKQNVVLCKPTKNMWWHVTAYVHIRV